jgi:hypothetical protein
MLSSSSSANTPHRDFVLRLMFSHFPMPEPRPTEQWVMVATPQPIVLHVHQFASKRHSTADCRAYRPAFRPRIAAATLSTRSGTPAPINRYSFFRASSCGGDGTDGRCRWRQIQARRKIRQTQACRQPIYMLSSSLHCELRLRLYQVHLPISRLIRSVSYERTNSMDARRHWTRSSSENILFRLSRLACYIILSG